jgi:signal transduction histidine kinase
MIRAATPSRPTCDSLATLAHELRNPLGSILNSIDLMRLVPGDAPLTARARATIEREALRMKRLIDDSLEIGRGAPPRFRLRKVRLDLEQALEEAVEAARSRPEASGRTLLVTSARETLWSEADPVHLAQIFGNLLTNACKYTDAGGRITVTLERAGSHAVVRVSDNGIGIREDMLASVFERYVQVDGQGSRARGGVGIGLALARELVERHAGTITAHSEGLGRGSEFVLRLPRWMGRPLALHGPRALVLR